MSSVRSVAGPFLAVWMVSMSGLAESCRGGAPEPIEMTDPLPYAQSPLDYRGAKTDDLVAGLMRRIDAGEATLRYEPGRGYLMSLLSALDVPVQSQVLVFSKTAVHRQLVGPKNPRAIYFNDEVYVAWVPGAEAIEMTAVDPQKGAIFYSLSQQETERPRFARQDNCLSCHASRSTLEVPGFMVRSVLTDEFGNATTAFPPVTHETPLAERWGGWYVSGTWAKDVHRGNRAGDVALHVEDVDRELYSWPHSDVAAHLVLEHQVHGQNLIARVHHEAVLGRRSDAEEKLVRYLLFAEEAELENIEPAGPEFVRAFESRGPFDEKGRSLRRLNLKSRLFEYRLSYLVYSRAFDGLPGDAKSRVVGAIREALSDRAAAMSLPPLPAEERAAIAEIVGETKPELLAVPPEECVGR